MTLLFPTCPTFELPLQRGSDLFFGIKYKELVVDGGGDPILDGGGNKQYAEAPYPAGSSVAVIIETNPPAAPNLVIDAEIDGSLAVIWGQSEDADTLTAGKLWRAIITYSDGLDKVLMNGKTGRYDS